MLFFIFLSRAIKNHTIYLIYSKILLPKYVFMYPRQYLLRHEGVGKAVIVELNVKSLVDNLQSQWVFPWLGFFVCLLSRKLSLWHFTKSVIYITLP